MVSFAIMSQLSTADASGAELADGHYIAGLKPSQRPEGAPTIGQVYKGDAWYRKALTGVISPFPYSLRFLEDQGHWHTPFNRPGMTGRYDIRGWHKP